MRRYADGDVTDLSMSLFRAQGKIINVKRDAKRRFGSKSKWPRDIFEHYERLKDKARALRQKMPNGGEPNGL